METKTFKILAAKSSIDWEGRKVTGAHNGTIDFKEGTLILSDGELTGGQFTADTTTIKVLDIADPTSNAQMTGHLASADFFSSEHYPEAKFVITSVIPSPNSTYKITGYLTIKGITHPAFFTATLVGNDGILTASGKITVDRTRYDMKFRSGNFFQNLGDTLIYNDFDLNILITAQAVSGSGYSKN